MDETKLFSGSPLVSGGATDSGKEPYWGLFNLSGRSRLGYHVSFWACFVAYHMLYFLPAFSSQVLDRELQISYTVYYLRFIPVFYVSLFLFYRFLRRFEGIPLLLMVFVSLLGSMHLATLAMYLALEHTFGLSELSPAFEAIGSLYLKADHKRQGWDWLVFVYDLEEIQLLILPVGIKMIQFGLRQQMAQARFEKEALRSELNILKSELEPHFVYNVISSAYAKILPTSRGAAGYLDKLSQMLKYTLYETNEDWAPLPAEIRSLKRYLQLERLRHGKRLRIAWYQEGKTTAKQKIPTLLMVTLGENAIKHGVRTHLGRSTVRVVIQVGVQSLNFTIENDKPLSNTATRKKVAHGLGLKNIQRRLDLLYPGTHQVEIRDSEDKYSVTLRIPLATI